MMTLPKISGEYSEVRSTFRGMPVQQRPGGALSFVDSGFGNFLIDEVFERQTIFARKAGWFKRSHLCRKCGAAIDGLEPSRLPFPLTIRYQSYPEFHLTIELPGVVCPSCNSSNALPSRKLDTDIPDSMLAAFGSQCITR